MFSLPQRLPNAYTSLRFCTWYVVANMVQHYEMNASCIKTIKITYSACKGSKIVRKKGMNKYLEAEQETGAYEVALYVVETAEESSVRKYLQAIVKRTHPFSSAGGSSQKKAEKESIAEALLQGAPQSGLSPTESSEEEEVALSLIRRRRG